MGLVDRLAGGKAYLDANVFIYAIERIGDFVPVISGILPALDEQRFHAVTSELTLAETLVKPLRDGNGELAGDYIASIQPRPALEVVPVSREILIDAARMRAKSGLKLPGAIHAATAVRSGCGNFVTNDARFRSLPGLDVLVLSELAQQH